MSDREHIAFVLTDGLEWIFGVVHSSDSTLEGRRQTPERICRYIVPPAIKKKDTTDGDFKQILDLLYTWVSDISSAVCRGQSPEKVSESPEGLFQKMELGLETVLE